MRLRLYVVAAFIILLGGCARRDTGVVTITYIVWGNASHLKVEQQIIDSFEKGH